LSSLGKVQSIEVGRGAVATLVVLAHARGYMTVGGAFGGLFRAGFPLSGFIIFVQNFRGRHARLIGARRGSRQC
jgi:hypothetical protein